ncbi:MAG: 4Fe-4S binding protein [Candidatus Bathyarchaeia archaeon]
MGEYMKRGAITSKELLDTPTLERLKRGWVAVIECPQSIPCDACLHACQQKAVKMERICDVPRLDLEKCIGCSKCMDACPGLAIFMMGLSETGKILVTIPYELLTSLKSGDLVKALDREGNVIGEAKVVRVFTLKGTTKSTYVTVEVDPKIGFEVRFIEE